MIFEVEDLSVSKNFQFMQTEAETSQAVILNEEVLAQSTEALPKIRTRIFETENRTGIVERIFDLISASVVLFITLPIFLIVSGVILLRSGRPIFYKQSRVGLNGKKFGMLKFRTMIPNAHAMKNDLLHLNVMSGPFFKIKEDPRVTPEGKLLRKWSLDELPQILNVLRGEMSLVGPRPMLPEEIVRLNCRDILSVKPGITGFWQVSGRNEVVDFRRKLAMDRLYVRKKSLRFDLALIWRTFGVILKGRGAY